MPSSQHPSQIKKCRARIRLSRKRRGLECGIRVKTHGDEPRADHRGAVPQNWSMAEQFLGLVPTRGVPSRSLLVSSLFFPSVPTKSRVAVVCLAVSRDFLESPIMSAQAGERVRTTRPTSEPQGWLSDIFLTWEAECQCA